MITKDWDKFHLPIYLNEECYNAIETFQGQRNINIPIQMKGLLA
jgi:hypothetical protein